MSIVQDAYYIPDDIATGLATGLYRRIGSVVRFAVGPNKGQIVKHLKPIELNSVEQKNGIGEKAIQFVMQHKKEAGFIAIGVAFVGAGVWCYSKWKSYEPKILVDFRCSLKSYIEAIRKGQMNTDTIDDLLNALECLKTHKDYKRIKVQLTVEEFEILVKRIYEYTVKLAEDNHYNFEGNFGLSDSAISNLYTCLEMQKNIFKCAS